MPVCPICAKPAMAETKPFCSTRCREVDLAKWFAGSYAVPSVELDEADAEDLEAALQQADRDESA